MLVTMNRQVFDSLDHAALGWACIEPTIRQMQSVKGHSKRSQIYAQLTAGQRALLMFRVQYDHAINSVDEFYLWFSYLLAESNYWPEVKAGMRYFGDDAMLLLLEETEGFLDERNRQGTEGWRNVRPRDLDDDPELLAFVNRLHTVFQEIAPATLERVGAYIRNNPGEFVQIED